MYLQVQLRSRSPTQVNSTLANQSPIAAPVQKPIDQDRVRDTSDPFEKNFALVGVGKSRLLQCSTLELVAACRSRSIVGARGNVTPSKLIAKLEAWKRQRPKRDNKADDAEEFDIRTVEDEVMSCSRKPASKAAQERRVREEKDQQARLLEVERTNMHCRLAAQQKAHDKLKRERDEMERQLLMLEQERKRACLEQDRMRRRDEETHQVGANNRAPSANGKDYHMAEDRRCLPPQRSPTRAGVEPIPNLPQGECTFYTHARTQYCCDELRAHN